MWIHLARWLLSGPTTHCVRYQGRPPNPQARTIPSSESRTGEANGPVARGFPCLSVFLNHSCLSPTHHNTTPPRKVHETTKESLPLLCEPDSPKAPSKTLGAGGTWLWQRTAPAAHFGPTLDPRSTPCLCLRSSYFQAMEYEQCLQNDAAPPLRTSRQLRFCLRVRAWLVSVPASGFCCSLAGLCQCKSNCDSGEFPPV